MAGHWRRRGNTIELRAYIGRDALSGRNRYATRTIPAVGKREADKALTLFMAELQRGVVPKAGARKSFGDLLEAWYAARSGDWSPGTQYQTRWMIDHRLAGLHSHPLRTLDTATLDKFYSALRRRGGRGGKPLSAASVRRVHGVVLLALDQAMSWGWRTDNPATKANAGKVAKPKITPPGRADVVRLLQAAEAKDPELLTFLFLDAETGARRGELAVLRLRDFHDESVRIERSLSIGLLTEDALRVHAGRIWPSGWRRGRRVTAMIEKDNPKNESSIRTISLSAATLELVRAQRTRIAERALAVGAAYPPNGFLFPATVDGTRPWRPERWTRRFGDLCDQLGVKARLHDVRHFVATTLLTSGVDLATVAGRLGHGGGGKTTLAMYSHFLREPDRAASDLMASVLTKAEPSEGEADVVPLSRGRRRRRSKSR